MIGQAKRLNELKHLYSFAPEKKIQCPLITFTSGKGGTGKSFCVMNTAIAIAEKNLKILVVDLDKNLSNLHIMLNKTPKESIYHFLSNKCLIEDTIEQVSENLFFIFGDSGKTDHPDLDNFNLDKLYNKLAEISEQFDLIFVDTGSGIGNDLKYLIKKSSSVILVTNPEPTAIMDSYVVLKEMKNLSFDKQKFILINKSIDPETGSEAFCNLEKAAKHFLDYNLFNLGMISNSIEYAKSILNQIPVMLNKEISKNHLVFLDIANKLINNIQLENNNQ